MRASTTLLVFVLAAVSSSPALAAPLQSTYCDRYPANCNHPVAARQDDSEALAIGKLASAAAKFAPAAIGLIGGLFHGHGDNGNSTQSRRDFEELFFARTDLGDESGAINFVPAAQVATKVLPWVTDKIQEYVDKHQGESADSTSTSTVTTRELIDLIARAGEDESDALSLKPLWGLLKGAAKTFFGGGDSGSDDQQQQQQRREFMELLARVDDDEAGALSLKPLWGLVKGAAKTFFGGGDSSSDDQQQQQQRRELVELLARAAVADDDEAGALSLKPLWGMVKGAAKAFFGGGDSGSDDQQQQQQRRELMELLARADDESDALSLKPLWGLVKGAAKTFFGGGDSSSDDQQQQQQQRREFIRLLARAVIDEEEEQQQQRREFFETRSLNDLD